METKRIKIILTSFLLLLSSLGFTQEIFNAIMQGNIDQTKALLAADSAKASNKNARGFSPIHFAANFNQLEIAKLLVSYGADPYEKGPQDRQPIHWASSANGNEVLKWLHKIGADINVKEATNKTPLYIAVSSGKDENIKYLWSQKAKIQLDSKEAVNLLYFAIAGDYEEIVQEYLDSDFDYKQLAKDGSNFMIAAAQSGNPKMISIFSNLGLDVNYRNDFGEAPIHFSINQKDTEVLETLLECGADINLPNYAGQNALSMAMAYDSVQHINFLKSKGGIPSEPVKMNGKYPGFKEPGLTPVLLAPGLISTPNFNERDAMFSASMDEFYFSKHSAKDNLPMTIKKMTKNASIWSEPKTAAFSGKHSDAECFITSDNKNLYLISQRPHDGSDQPSTWEIWKADRHNNQWDHFQLFDTTNLKGCFYPSLTKDGELLYTSPGNDLFLAKLRDGKVVDTKKLGNEINTESGEYNAMISPEGDYIILTSHGFEDHYGAGDLYISFRREDKSWTPSINMGPTINTSFLEYCPNISSDGKYFFFTSNRKGTEDIYWMDASIIEQLRLKAFKEQ